jgi:hypothetical protein
MTMSADGTRSLPRRTRPTRRPRPTRHHRWVPLAVLAVLAWLWSEMYPCPQVAYGWRRARRGRSLHEENSVAVDMVGDLPADVIQAVQDEGRAG